MKQILITFYLFASVFAIGQNKHTVGSGMDFENISSAISFASANDTIEIHGTITESGINLNKSLVFKGFGHEASIIQAHAEPGLATEGIFIIPSGFNIFFYDLTLRNGNTVGPGGAIYSGDNSISLINCEISNNYAGIGGALYIANNNLSIQDSYFFDNHSDIGGAIFISYSNAIVSGSYFIGNTSDSTGGAIHIMEGELILMRTDISNNQSELGGGIYSENSSGYVLSCLVTGNISIYDGAGIYVDNQTTDEEFHLRNSLLADNNSNQSGGGLYFQNINTNSNVVLLNSTIANNFATNSGNGFYHHKIGGATISALIINNTIMSNGTNNYSENLAGTSTIIRDYSLLSDNSLPTPGDGNINNSSPLFEDAAAGNFKLLSNSPCINAGIPDTIGLMIAYDGLDLAGDPRIFEGEVERIDMGCYEFQGDLPCDLAIYELNGNAADLLGNYNGTNFGATSAINRFNQNNHAMKFYNAYINTNTSLLPAANPWTVNMWIYPTEFNNTAGNALFGQFETSGLPNGRFSVEIDNILQNNISIRYNASSIIESSAVINPYQWQMVTIVRDASFLHIYYNGLLDNSIAFSDNILSDNLILGVHDEGFVSVRDYKGRMDDVSIHDCALNSDQILELYNTPSPCEGFSAQTYVINDASVYGLANGSGYVVPTGGEAPYNYLWTSGLGLTNDTINNLVGNTWYNVAVTDANQCFVVASLMVGQPLPLSLVITSVDNTCGMISGEATVTVTGGVPPYSYVWSNGDISATADSLIAGMYSVQVLDANGALASGYITISDANGPEIIVNSIIPVSCFNSNDGAIDISISGGTAPLIIFWWSGQTTEDISGLEAGPYEVQVVDFLGCSAMKSITVDQPNPIIVSPLVTPASCSSSDGSIELTVVGGTIPYTYLWSNGGTTNIETGLSAGTYSVTIVDNNGCQRIRIIPVNNLLGPIILVDSVLNASCEINTGAIYTTVYGGSLPYSTVEWSNGTSDVFDLTGEIPGTYSLVVTDDAGCISSITEEIATNIPESQEICLVTVDSTASRNLIVWEKPLSTEISYFNIYKETTMADVYHLVASRSYDSISVYIDPLSNPLIRSWRYKLSVVDVCGNESELSDFHKTIHMAINLGLSGEINLNWDNYEGFEYLTFNVYRYSTSLGFELYAEMPSNLNACNDYTPPVGIVTYAVSVVKPDGDCLGTKDIGGPYQQSVSNLEDNSLGIGIEKEIDLGLSIYPNPGHGLFTLQVKSLSENSIMEVYSIDGSMVFSSTLNKGTNHIDLQQLSSGVYTVIVKGAGTVLQQKVVVNK